MSPSATFLRLLRTFLQYRWRIFGGLVAVAMMSLAEAANAFLIARLFDVLQTISTQVRAGQEIFVQIPFQALDRMIASFEVRGQEGSFRMIFAFAAAVLGIILVKAVFVYVREMLMSSVQQKLLRRIRVELFDTVVALPVRYFDAHRTGHIMSRITNDVNNLEQSLYLMVEIAQNIVYALIFASALFFASWELTLVTIAIFTLSGFISRSFGERIRRFSRELTNTLAEISSFLQEKISAVRVVKSFTREEHERAAFRTRVDSNYHFSMKIVRTIALLSPTNEVFNTAAASLLVVFAGYLFIQGTMTIETMIFFLILMVNLAKPVKALGESIARIQKTLVSAGFIFEVIDQEREADGATADASVVKQGDVEFRNVTFAYQEGVFALQNVSFKVRRGEKIALVGPSGAGKSTIINLVPRFYAATSGAVLVDGIDVSSLSLKALRGSIAVVPQDTILFSGTVLENIRYGRLDATDQEVEAAAGAANVDQFVRQLDKGYATEVGERGAQLSGGQRQRIAIARAILRDPRILLLDEATSALDSESELMVQEALDRLMEGRTSFIIAHRLSTVRHCDRIFVLDGGQIVESGTHAQLLRRSKGVYRRLHALQFSEGSA
ncbi:MAG: ABC transporter ATP-binding protein/permease [Bacteroidetes bacterium]|jgi:subfamily B ATP-binding cassette protein MsbA|nr:ABC transporter ATP-binding protein/permease [Bacteroidota bacterium]